MRFVSKISLAGMAAVAAMVVAAPASASTVVATDCISVTDADGCLFSGNINGNTDPTNVNSYLNAQNAYNAFNDTPGHASAQPDISLTYLFANNDLTFPGSITGTGTSSGTWSTPGYLIDFIAVKAGDYFVLYQLASPASSGSWDTLDIPYLNSRGQGEPKALSHLAFFGTETAVPEPAQWAMMIAGFGLVGAAMRRRRPTVARTVLA